MGSYPWWAIGSSSVPLPTPAQRKAWKGAFVIPDALPGIPFGDGRRIWTPAYACYDAHWRQAIRRAFKARGYTHFPYNLAGDIYHGQYGYVTDDPARARRDLIELLTDGFIPVVAACDDIAPSVVPWRSFSANADLIPICFPMWEMNGPLGVPIRQPDGSYAGPGIDVIRNTRNAAPKADLYLHFTAGHGAPGYPEERASWRWVRDQFGVMGLLSQDSGYDRNRVTGDPEGTAAGLADTAWRLGQEGLVNVAYEQTTTPVFHHWDGWNEQRQRHYGAYLAEHATGIAGYCDGGI